MPTSLASGRFLRPRGLALLTLLASPFAAWAQPVLVTAPQTVGPEQTEITPTAGGDPVPLATAEITVRGTTLTMNGRHQIESLVVEPNGATAGVVAHSNAFSFDYAGDGSDVVNGLHLIISGDCIISFNSRIDVSTRGFAPAQGPGAGSAGSCTRGGGGHGGPGADGRVYCGNRGIGGVSYGSITQPVQFGSGGAERSGGGCLHIVCHSLIVDGKIVANGSAGSGGGAGGSILLYAQDISGAGEISADGGGPFGSDSTFHGGGGGGRIAVFVDNHEFAGDISASGAGEFRTGGAGTIFVSKSNVKSLEIHNDFQGRETPVHNYVNHIDQLAVSGFAVATIDHHLISNEVVLLDSSWITHTAGSQFGLHLSCEQMTLEQNARIDVSGKGFAALSGPGAGTRGACTGGGGGHGGRGSNGRVYCGNAGQGGPVYGHEQQPNSLGSGGAAGRGGGRVKVNVSGMLGLNGMILADGFGGDGGGSGGSILVSANSINGNGTISARGGAGTIGNVWHGAGGGGRVAVYTCSNDSSSFQIRVDGGGGSRPGDPGTIFSGYTFVEIAPTSMLKCRGNGIAINSAVEGSQASALQWYQNTEPIGDGQTPWGSLISGSQTGTLFLENIQPEDAGLYSVIATTECGIVESNAVAVDVYCDCEPVVVVDGTDDNFALPREPTFPSSDLSRVLLERRPGRPFHEFDQIPAVTPNIESDSRIAHSFMGLPSDIVSARLTMRVQAGGSGNNTTTAEGTDSIRLGFATPQSTGAGSDDRVWERRFGDLPGDPTGLFDAGQIWTRGDSRLFSLDLAALPTAARLGESDPNAVNLISQLNSHGFLDVTVVDETGVDFMSLEMELSDGTVVPWVATPMRNVSVFEKRPAEISVLTAGEGGPFGYRWRFEGVEIDPGVNPTATAQTLLLNQANLDDAGSYDCVVTGANTCGEAVSSPITLEVLCLADYNQDGSVSFFDLAAFLADFTDSDLAADIAAPFGILDFFDISALITVFQRGCP